MVKLRRILLVEDNPNDAELTLEALAEHHLANAVDRVKDGEEAPDGFRARALGRSRAPRQA
jgi:CheY-like chemotaxis protein